MIEYLALLTELVSFAKAVVELISDLVKHIKKRAL